MLALEHQASAIKAVRRTFKTHDRCHIVMACGTGKTFTAFQLAMDMHAHTIAIYVPTLALISQSMAELISNVTITNTLAILAICSDEGVTADIEPESILINEFKYPVATTADAIRDWYDTTPKDYIRIVFCTYASAWLLSAALRSNKDRAALSIDLAIFDEAHKTAGYNKHLWGDALLDENIKIKKRLFMTATPRHCSVKEQVVLSYSMDDEVIYGPCAYNLSFRAAINRGLICDYQVLISHAKTASHAFGEGYDLHEKAHTLLDAMRQVSAKKVISFHSTISDAKTFAQHLTASGIPNVFHISSHMTIVERAKVMTAFSRANTAIITNARCLTEGVNVPTVDMVAFMSPKSSKIDIIQAIGRSLRKAPGKSVGYILLPVLLPSNAIDDIKTTAFNDVWEVINALTEQDEALVSVISQLNANAGLQDTELNIDGLAKFIKVIEPIAGSMDFTDLIKVRLVERLTQPWMHNYGKLCSYKALYGTTAVSAAIDKPLSMWGHKQVHDYRIGELSTDKITLLEDIGFALTKAFKYKTFEQSLADYSEGLLSKDKNPTISAWVRETKKKYNKGRLTAEQISMILAVDGLFFESHRARKVRPLIETNKYLRDPAQRERLINRSVETSSAVEGIYVKLQPKYEENK